MNDELTENMSTRFPLKSMGCILKPSFPSPIHNSSFITHNFLQNSIELNTRKASLLNKFKDTKKDLKHA